MRRIAITGVGSYLPKQMRDNASLSLETPATDEELARIGVHRRGIASDEEGIAEMGAAAATRALEQAGVTSDAIDFVILSSWTERRYIPEFAPRLLHQLNMPRAFGWDVCCACAGFLASLAMAEGMLQQPRFQRALVVASERTSRRARPGSRGMLVLGDAAGAFVLEARDAIDETPGRLIDVEIATDGSKRDIMSISDEGWVKSHVEQRELTALAGESMRAVATRLLERNRLTLDDLAWVIPHSGTAGVQASLGKRLGAKPERVLTNFADVGNVSSASIPTALDAFSKAGVVRPGDLVLSLAVGTGWYSAAALYTAC
jgi:3-oxoacyl-[acyl-carrier-protein] synthase-3